MRKAGTECFGNRFITGITALEMSKTHSLFLATFLISKAYDNGMYSMGLCNPRLTSPYNIVKWGT